MIGLDSVAAEYLQTYPLQLPTLNVLVQQCQWIDMQATAEKAFETYEAKYPKAAACLRKDLEALLAFCRFPAEHWQHIQTTNPIESTFATVRQRTAKILGCLFRTTVLTMAFQLVRYAEKIWRRLRGYKRLTEIIEGVKFVDGESRPPGRPPSHVIHNI
jgi:hypothetical protein